MKIFFSLILSLLIAVPSSAAEPLTWERSVELAYGNNPDILSALRSFDASRESYRQSFNGIFPRLSLSSSYVRGSNDNRETRWQAGGNASMDLFDKAVLADIRQAAAAMDRSEATYRNTASTILFDLRQSFANLLFAQEQSRVAEQIRNIRGRNARLVGLRYNSGRESKGNMMRANAELLQSEKNVSQAQRSVDAARRKMAESLGASHYDHGEATGTLSIPLHQKPSEELLADMTETHPLTVLSRTGISSAEAAASRSTSGLWPTLTANYSRSFRDDTYFPGNGAWTASGVVSYPLFSGGPTSVYHDVRAKRAALQSAEEDLRSTLNGIRSDLDSSFAALAAAGEDIQVQEAFLDAARQRNAEADIRYSNGLMSYEDWERIVSERVNFEQSLIRARRDAVIAEANWNRATGKVLTK